MSRSSMADPRACSPARRPDWSCSCSTRRICSHAPGSPYAAPDGADWPDNAFRFAALSRVAAEIGQGAIPAFIPQIVHTHDWHAGLTHAFMHYNGRPRPGTIITVHNLAFQGRFPRELLGDIGLPPASRSPSTGSSTMGRSGSSKPGCSSPTASPPSRRPMRWKSRRPTQAWDWTACCARGRTC